MDNVIGFPGKNPQSLNPNHEQQPNPEAAKNEAVLALRDLLNGEGAVEQVTGLVAFFQLNNGEKLYFIGSQDGNVDSLIGNIELLKFIILRAVEPPMFHVGDDEEPFIDA